MARQGYTVRDAVTGKYLELIQAIDTGGVTAHCTEWTRHAERAWPFRGFKSARRAAELLGGGMEIQIRRGVTIWRSGRYGR